MAHAGSVKGRIRNTPFFPYLKSAKRAFKRLTIRDTADTLVYVHIGKCGGASLLEALLRSPVVKAEFRDVQAVHIRKPPVLKQARYLIVVRNPVARALSAFNWRYRLVVEDEAQKSRFRGEYAILKKYGTLNALAEALYTPEGTLDRAVAAEFRSIHHLKEDIAFYLTDLLQAVDAGQIRAVLATEFLDEDMSRILQTGEVERVHSNRGTTGLEKLELSSQARDSLRRFLAEDYAAVEKLLDLKNIGGSRREKLLA